MQNHYTPNQPHKPSASATDKSSASVSQGDNVAAAVRSLFPQPAVDELIRLDAVYPDTSQRDRRLFDAVNLTGLKEFCAKHSVATIVFGSASYRKGPNGKVEIYRLHSVFVVIDYKTAEEEAAARRRIEAFALQPRCLLRRRESYVPGGRFAIQLI